MVLENFDFVQSMAIAGAVVPAAPVPADDNTMTHRRLAELRMQRKGQTDFGGALVATNVKFKRAPPAQFAMALEAESEGALEQVIFQVTSTLEALWTKNASVKSNYIQTFSSLARIVWRMDQPVPLPATITLEGFNSGNPINLPRTALVVRHAKLSIWQGLDAVIDLMYSWITYLDWKEAENLTQTQALMSQFHGADPSLTAEQRRVSTVMAAAVLRGRGGVGNHGRGRGAPPYIGSNHGGGQDGYGGHQWDGNRGAGRGGNHYRGGGRGNGGYRGYGRPY